MKALLLCILFFGFVALTNAQTNNPVIAPAITIEESSYDFGDLAQGDKVEHTFKFTNSGKAPLIITNVQVTCGCTVPKGWPKDPIAAGDKAELTIAFNSAGKMGKQNKIVTIVSNAPGSNTISFTANVIERTKNQ